MVSDKQASLQLLIMLIAIPGIRQHTVCRGAVHWFTYLLDILGICAGSWVVVGRLFALITHKRKANVYILNTLIPWSTSPPPLLSQCSWCTHYCWKWCSNTERRGWGWVGELEQETDSERGRNREKERGKANLWWYLFSPVAASGSFFFLLTLSSLLINLWNITVRFWAHIAVFYA